MGVEYMKVNFGCGRDHKKGYLNVDYDDGVKPDRIIDLNTFPYPFKKSSLDEAYFNNVLEHLLVDLPDLAIEMRRIIKPNGKLHIRVPNSYYFKNRLLFLRGEFRRGSAWHINHSFLLKPSELELYFTLSNFEVHFVPSGHIWEKLKTLNKNMFLQEINMIGRLRP